MDWYFKEMFRDKRFRIAAAVAGGALLLIIVCALMKTNWGFNLAAFVFFPILMLGLLGMFGVLGLIVRADYNQRKGKS